ncbi:unnamed protein product, partial [Ixodes persulcatus]
LLDVSWSRVGPCRCSHWCLNHILLIKSWFTHSCLI